MESNGERLAHSTGSGQVVGGGAVISGAVSGGEVRGKGQEGRCKGAVTRVERLFRRQAFSPAAAGYVSIGSQKAAGAMRRGCPVMFKRLNPSPVSSS